MIKKLIQDINNEIPSLLNDTNSEFQISENSKIIFDMILDFVKRDGKRIRPLLFILGYLGYTPRKSISYKKLLRTAISFELLHAFLLIHDDIIDNSDLRRGKPSMHKKLNSKLKIAPENILGKNLSIVIGDIIYAISINSFLSLQEDHRRKEKALKMFTKTAAATGIGEFIDTINGSLSIEKVTKSAISLTYVLKTAKYTFEAPLLIGALLAGAKPNELLKISNFGRNLGIAFQIQDDLLDIFSSTEETGKPIFSDLLESKKTFLIYHSYNALTKNDKAIFNRHFNKKNKTKKDLSLLFSMIKKTNAYDVCLDTISKSIISAEENYESLLMKHKYKTVLKTILNKIKNASEKHRTES